MRHRILMISVPIVAVGLTLSVAYFAPAPQRPSPGISFADYRSSASLGNQNTNVGLPGADSVPIIDAAHESRVPLLVGLVVLVVIAVVAAAMLAWRRGPSAR